MVVAVKLAVVFEVALVQPNVPVAMPLADAALSLIIEQVYRLKGFQLVGRRAWLNSQRFDIEAKPAAPLARDECLLMVRKLLAERFKLAVHGEVSQDAQVEAR